MHRHLVQVLGEVADGLADPHELRVLGRAPLEVGPCDVAPEVGESGPLLRLGDDDEVPVLRVARRRRLLREPQAVLEHVALDRARQVEPLADGARGREQLVGRQVEDHWSILSERGDSGSDNPRVLRSLAAFAGVFLGVLVVLLAAVGQLGKVDVQTFVAVLVAAAVVAAVAAWRTRRT